jgi:sugar lactone lactonase YvrE
MNQPITIQPIGGRVSQWGEGPIFFEDHLLYVDIEGHTLIRLNPETGSEETWEMGERIGTVVPVKTGGFLCAGDSGIYTFDPNTGERKKLADPEAEKRPDNRFNDGKCDPSGRFWAGTISTVKKTGDANLYMLDGQGKLSLKVSSVTNSNGICWHSDASVMYYVDTPTKKIMAYPFDNQTGEIGEPSLVMDTEDAGIAGSPDGMTIDAEDRLWVAMCHGGLVVCVDPVAGQVYRKIEFPCVETTACAFGGPELNRLFVTTGLHKTLQEPDAGRIFVVDGLHASGTPSFSYGR